MRYNVSKFYHRPYTETKSLTHRISYVASMAILSPRINFPKRETVSSSQISAKVYIHRFPVILHDNLQRDSHKYYGPSVSVTLLQLLCGQSKTDSSTANGISLGSLKIPALEAGDFVQSILL
jgi:hypothetical protein